MAFDYGPLVAVADQLIADFGRAVTLFLPAQGAAADDWGAREAGRDVELTGVPAAFLEPRQEDREDRNIETHSDRVLVATGNLAGNVLDERWRVVDGDREFEVVLARPIQPGPTIVYFELLVNV